jgi:transcriptional regulator with XRE-family HTH domain
MKNLAQKIREERKALGLTLEQFAKLVGTSNSMLQRVETATKSPSVSLLMEISNICRKPIDYFFNEEPIGFRKFDPKEQKIIYSDDFNVTILCPYGLISRDAIVSHFKGKAGAVVIPPNQSGYCWVYIIKGTCIFEHDGVPHDLQEGDSIYYDSKKPHVLKILTPLESIRITMRR